MLESGFLRDGSIHLCDRNCVKWNATCASTFDEWRFLPRIDQGLVRGLVWNVYRLPNILVDRSVQILFPDNLGLSILESTGDPRPERSNG